LPLAGILSVIGIAFAIRVRKTRSLPRVTLGVCVLTLIGAFVVTFAIFSGCADAWYS
jgi:hypothetical protein